MALSFQDKIKSNLTGDFTATSTDSGSDPTSFNPDADTTKERLQNTLYNGSKALQESVENGSIQVSDSLQTISEASPSPDQISDSFDSDSSGQKIEDLMLPEIFNKQFDNEEGGGFADGFNFPQGPVIPDVQAPSIDLTPGFDLSKTVKYGAIGVAAVLVASQLGE